MDICRLTYLAAVAQTPPSPNAERFLDYAWSLCQVLLRHQAPGGGLFDGGCRHGLEEIAAGHACVALRRSELVGCTMCAEVTRAVGCCAPVQLLAVIYEEPMPTSGVGSLVCTSRLALYSARRSLSTFLER